MARELARNVQVGRVMYPAGSTPPKDVAEQITNPKAWAAEPEPEESDKKPAKKAAAKRSSSSN